MVGLLSAAKILPLANTAILANALARLTLVVCAACYTCADLRHSALSINNRASRRTSLSHESPRIQNFGEVEASAFTSNTTLIREVNMATVEMEDAKPQPLSCDLGHLLCNDPNPLPSLKSAQNDAEREAILASTARTCAQTLINQLLSNCPIARNEDTGDLQITLPPPELQLPREKPLPQEKEKTKWEKFAAKKGIQKKKRDGKLEFDEAKGDWVPKYGYKGKNTDDGDWLVEVDEKAERAKANGEDGMKGGNKRSKKGR